MSSDQDPFANGADPFAQNVGGAEAADPFAQIAAPAANGNDPFSQMNASASPVASGVNTVEEVAPLGKKGKKANREKPAKAKKEKVVRPKKEKSLHALPAGPYTWALWSALGSCVIAMTLSLLVFGVRYGFAMKP